MAIDLKTLSPKELQALIAGASAQMNEARSNQVRTVREKIDALLKNSGLTLAEVFPTRGGKKAAAKKGSKGSVAPKYHNPADPSQQWTGRGRQPLWFAQALRKRGVTADHLLIAGAAKAAAPAKAAKKAAKKAVKKVVRKTAKKAVQK
ncbi:H-NS histone family protein [Dyella silvatica]|uniref:H-NS histone family protein n=1 Tax=Dyella silvatica TaxID=2992128 RepID=UPI00224F4CC9|nr:H-NS histone family protein [Dyella silvatica]